MLIQRRTVEVLRIMTGHDFIFGGQIQAKMVHVGVGMLRDKF